MPSGEPEPHQLRPATAQSRQALGAYSGKRGGQGWPFNHGRCPLAVRREHQDLQLFLLPFCTSKHLSSGKSHSSHPKHVCATALTVQEAVQVWPRCRSCTAPANRWGRGNLPILPGTNPQSTPIKCMLNYSHS